MRLMKFGLALPYVSARKVAQLSKLAEESGWDGCFLGDAIWCEDPMIGLAAAALTTPFDFVFNGKTAGLDCAQLQDKLITWWVEGMWGEAEEPLEKRIRQGPPQLS